MKIIRILLQVAFAVVVCGLYLYALHLAGDHSRPNEPVDPSRMPGFFVWVLSSTSVMLAANLGSLVGVKVPEKIRDVHDLTLGEWLRSLAGLFYLGSWIYVMVLWRRAGWTEDPREIVSHIPEIGRAVVGVAFAAVAVVLGVRAQGVVERSGGPAGQESVAGRSPGGDGES